MTRVIFSFKGIDYAEDNGFTLIIARCQNQLIMSLMQRNERLISSFGPPQTWRYFTGCGCGFRPKRDDCNYPYDDYAVAEWF
jgi:hypothetical protein